MSQLYKHLKEHVQLEDHPFSASSLTLGYVAKTANYTATDSDQTIDCAGTFTVTLPTAVGIKGKIYVVKNSGTGTITIDGDGSETIDAALTQSIAVQYKSLVIQSTDAVWVIIESYTPPMTASAAGIVPTPPNDKSYHLRGNGEWSRGHLFSQYEAIRSPQTILVIEAHRCT